MDAKKYLMKCHFHGVAFTVSPLGPMWHYGIVGNDANMQIT